MTIFRYRLFWTAILGVLGYILVVRYTPLMERGDGLRAIALVLSGWGLFAWWRPFWKALATQGWPKLDSWAALMVFVFCAAINLNCCIGLFWRLAGQPAFLINNALFDFWIVLGIVALAIAVSIPNLFGEGVPPIDKIQVGTVWLVMFALVTYLVIQRPDLAPLADAVRPALDNGRPYRDPD